MKRIGAVTLICSITHDYLLFLYIPFLLTRRVYDGSSVGFSCGETLFFLDSLLKLRYIEEWLATCFRCRFKPGRCSTPITRANYAEKKKKVPAASAINFNWLRWAMIGPLFTGSVICKCDLMTRYPMRADARWWGRCDAQTIPSIVHRFYYTVV